MVAGYFFADKIWTRSVMQKFSWSGGSKNTGVSKIAFKTLRHLIKFFHEIVKIHASACTLNEVENFLKTSIVQHAKRRAETIGARESTPKYRVRRVNEGGKPNRKKKVDIPNEDDDGEDNDGMLESPAYTTAFDDAIGELPKELMSNQMPEEIFTESIGTELVPSNGGQSTQIMSNHTDPGTIAIETVLANTAADSSMVNISSDEPSVLAATIIENQTAETITGNVFTGNVINEEIVTTEEYPGSDESEYENEVEGNESNAESDDEDDFDTTSVSLYII